jgi:threonine/homoserine/homoserine lactone efflux protein
MEALLGLAGFSFVAAVTPGPNNVVLWSIGLRHGYRAAIPFLLGVLVGMAIMVMAAALGLGALITSAPALGIGLKVVGSAYLLYLAWRLVGIANIEEADVASAPGFAQSVGFQFVNVKGWFFVLTAVAAFRPVGVDLPVGALLMALVMMAVVIPSAGLWAVGGDALSRFIRSPRAHRAVNVALAIVLVAMVVLIWV